MTYSVRNILIAMVTAVAAAVVVLLYTSLVNRLQDLREGERGQTMAEYAVILGVITAIVIAAILALSGGITGRLNEITAIL